MLACIVTANTCCRVPSLLCELCLCGCSLLAAKYYVSQCMTTVTLLGVADVSAFLSHHLPLCFSLTRFFHKSSDFVSSFCLTGGTAANGMSSLTKLSD